MPLFLLKSKLNKHWVLGTAVNSNFNTYFVKPYICALLYEPIFLDASHPEGLLDYPVKNKTQVLTTSFDSGIGLPADIGVGTVVILTEGARVGICDD